MQWYEIIPLDDLWIGEMVGVEAGVSRSSC